MERKFILVKWPYSQPVMEHERFHECYLLHAFDRQERFNSAYFVPEDLYKEINTEMDEVKYLLVEWPYSQMFMEHERFSECYLVHALEGQEYYDSAYFIPEDLYEVFKPEIDRFDETMDRYYGDR